MPERKPMDPKHPESEIPRPDRSPTMPPKKGDVPEGLATWEMGLDARFKAIREFLESELSKFEKRIVGHFESLRTHLDPVVNRALRDSDTDRRLAAAEAELKSLRAHCRACPSYNNGSQ
jgi:hypothetical protein